MELTLIIKVKIHCIINHVLLVLDLEVNRKSHAVNQGQLPLMPILEPLSKSYRLCWGQMVFVLQFLQSPWEILAKSEAWAKTGHSRGKATGNSFGGLARLLGRSLRESPGQGKESEPGWWRLSHRAWLLALFRERLSMETKTSASTSVWEKAGPSSSPNTRHFPPCISLVTQAFALALVLRGSESE